MFESNSRTTANFQIADIGRRAVVVANKVFAGAKSEKIRVLRVAHASLTPALRGRERGIARKFPRVEMEVVTPRRWREKGVDVCAVADEYFPVRTARTFLSRHIQLFAYDPRPIIEALRRHRPHLIDMDHEPYSLPCAEIIALRNLFAPQTPIVMQTAQNIFKNYPPPFSLFERRALRQIAGAYMCSLTVKEVLDRKHFHKPQRVVPFGVDLEQFRFHQRERKNVLTVGYVGRLLPAKGLSTLIDALWQIKNESWRLLVVGDGEERINLERGLRERGLRDRAELVGAVHYDETPDYFRQIDVLVVPTVTTNKIREQFGRVIVEAMASGAPVIGSTCGAIPEVVGDAGLIFAENNPNALAAELLKMLRNDDLRRDLAIAGRRRVEENYTWERVAEGIFDLYCEVLENAATERGEANL